MDFANFNPTKFMYLKPSINCRIFKKVVFSVFELDLV